MGDVRLLLVRGAIITGTIRDSTGEPAPGVDVVVERRSASQKDAAASTVKTTTSTAFGLRATTWLARPRLPGIATAYTVRGGRDADEGLAAPDGRDLQRRVLSR
jgi:hypothetical protein